MIWHSTSIDEVIEKLSADTDIGLTEKSVAIRHKKYGYNKAFSTEKKSFVTNFFSQFKGSIVIVELIACILYGICNIFIDKPDWVKPCILFGFVILNAVVLALIETYAGRGVLAASQKCTQNAKVIREGKETLIDSSDLVPGDLLILSTGDYIPCDARIYYSDNLRCDESVLTGEFVPVEKNHTAVLTDIESLSKRVNMVFSGCCVASGSCKAIVTETGSFTETGKVATALLRDDNVLVDLQKRLKTPIKRIVTALFVVSFLYIIIGLFIAKDAMNWTNLFLNGVTLAYTCIPIAFSALVLINLFFGVQRALNNNIIIKDISALETVCTVNTIVSDKTGTLTQDRMKAVKAYINNETIDIDNLAPDEVRSMLKIAALTCDGNVKIDDFGREEHFGDIVETSILAAAFKLLKTDKVTLDSEYPRMGEIPLDSDRKLKTVICLIDGHPYAIVKGIAANVIEKCNDIDKEELLKTVNELCGHAYRVIGIAYKPLDEVPSMPSAELIECGLNFSGLIATANLPRAESKMAIRECEDCGITTIMITADTIETAKSSAKKLGILSENSICITGEELSQISDEELENIILDITVYSDISSEQRVKIVKMLKAKGKTVAITGDSVSDAIALKESDIGCAMGISGTALTKNASKIIINDDSFSTIVGAIKHCKGIYFNIRKSLKQLFTVNFALVSIVLFGLIIFRAPILNSVMLMIIGLLFNTLSACVIAFDPPEKDVLKKPVYKSDSIIGKEFSIDVAFQVIVMTVLTLTAYFIGSKNNYGYGTTYAFDILCLAALLLSYSNRSEKSILSIGLFRSPLYIVGFIIDFIILVIVTTISPISAFFGLKALKFSQIIICAIIALVVPVSNEAYKIFRNKFFK